MDLTRLVQCEHLEKRSLNENYASIILYGMESAKKNCEKEYTRYCGLTSLCGLEIQCSYHNKKTLALKVIFLQLLKV